MTNLLEDFRELAIRAHSLISYSPEKRGNQMIEDYSKELESDLEFIRNYGGDEKRYIDHFRKYFSAWISAKSRCASPMITGPARFPVKKNNKAFDMERKRGEEFFDWRKRAKNAIARDARKENKSISKDIEDIKKRIVDAEKLQELMKFGNKIAKKSSGDLDKIISELVIKFELSEIEVKKILYENYFKKFGFPSSRLTNNNASIKQMKSRLVELEKRESASIYDSATFSFSNGEVILDFADDRVKILYNTKPDPKIIYTLKKGAFHWSPKNHCWQRQLTVNGLSAAISVTDVDPKALIDKYREVRGQ